MFRTPPSPHPSMHDTAVGGVSLTPGQLTPEFPAINPVLPRLHFVDFYHPKDQLWRLLLKDRAANELYYLETPLASDFKTPKEFPAGTWNVAPRRVDKSRVVPKHTPEMLKIRETDITETRYVKEPEWLKLGKRLFSGTPQVHFTREIQTYNDDYVKGLVFDRYTMNLYDFVNQGGHFDAKKVLSDIEAGIDHMHSLGLVHCDIKPSNIFIDVPNQRVVVGDFDSTHHIGDPITGKRGTRFWSDGRFTEANRENDFYGLSMIRHWLKHRGFGEPEKGEWNEDTTEILEHAHNPVF